MKTSVFLGTLAAAGLAAGVAAAGTLADVKAKGFVQFGISTGVAGFAFTTPPAAWDGLHTDICPARAAARFAPPQARPREPPSPRQPTGRVRLSGVPELLCR